MTEPNPERPVPGPPRPGPVPADGPPTGSTRPADRSAGGAAGGSGPAVQQAAPETDPRSTAASFQDLEQRPVAEHVGVFEAEHARLHRELGTIDQL